MISIFYSGIKYRMTPELIDICQSIKKTLIDISTSDYYNTVTNQRINNHKI